MGYKRESEISDKLLNKKMYKKSIKESILKLYPTAVPRLYTVPCKGDCTVNGVSYCPVKKMKISKNVDVKF